MEDNFNLKKIIDSENIITLFQPVISIRKKSIIGFEALTRGIDIKTGNIIPPDLLFKTALKEELVVELDRLCRKKNIVEFKNIYISNKNLILFLNFDTVIVDKGVVGSGHIAKLSEENNIDPGNIVIEIIESKIENSQLLEKFVNNYKNLGFLIVLDDIGAGYSNFDRVSIIKPDIIKADRSIISNINNEYYKQEILKSLINLSHKIGALLVAEGVENKEETLNCFEYGADLFQGYYFSKPEHYNPFIFEKINNRMPFLSGEINNYLTGLIELKKEKSQKYDSILNGIISELEKIHKHDFEKKLIQIIEKNNILECLYVLDYNGIQITETIGKEFINNKKLIFSPDRKNVDQSMKDYFLFIKAGLSKYTTDPYISLASGKLCITISSIYTSADNQKYILCIDLNN
jgi:EAL domain-containing protein (putative c-di-GMP-specific phosphodiesterase class I)